MIRSIAVLVSAILLSSPRMPTTQAARYARALNAAAKEHDFDPLTAVAIIHFESRWRPNAISPDGEDYGLGQVRGRFLAACRDDADPVGAPSDACRAAKGALLHGETNIKRMASIITANRELCREKTGSAKVQQWLAGYAGLNFPSRGRWCQPGEKQWRVVAYRRELIAKLLPKPKRATKPKRVIAAKVSRGAAPAKRTAR